MILVVGGVSMKKDVHHVTIMDSALCIPSLLYRIVKNSVINPCERYFIFVFYSGNFYDSKIRQLINLSTLSTVNGFEKVSVSVIDSRQLNIQRALSSGEVEYSKVNIVLFDSFKTALKYFTIDEVDLLFLGDNQQIMTDILSSKCLITPSIAMTTCVSNMFHKYNIPFKFVEYFREILFVRGAADATIHMKQSILHTEGQTPIFSPDDIDDILSEFFSDIMKDDETNEEDDEENANED